MKFGFDKPKSREAPQEYQETLMRPCGNQGMPARRVGLRAQQFELPPRRLRMRPGRVAEPRAEIEAFAAHAQHERRRRIGQPDLPIYIQDTLRG